MLKGKNEEYHTCGPGSVRDVPGKRRDRGEARDDNPQKPDLHGLARGGRIHHCVQRGGG